MASAATKLGLEGATQAIMGQPNLIANLAIRATEQAATGVQEAIASPAVNNTLQLAGLDATAALMDGAVKAVGAQASAAPESLKANLFKKLADFLGSFGGNP